MLRDEIARIIYNECDNHKGYHNYVADAILDLPSELEAVKECPNCKSIPGPKVTCGDYPPCDSGYVTRRLSIREALEIPAMLINGRAKVRHVCHIDGGILSTYIELPSGERVRRAG